MKVKHFLMMLAKETRLNFLQFQGSQRHNEFMHEANRREAPGGID